MGGIQGEPDMARRHPGGAGHVANCRLVRHAAIRRAADAWHAGRAFRGATYSLVSLRAAKAFTGTLRRSVGADCGHRGLLVVGSELSRALWFSTLPLDAQRQVRRLASQDAVARPMATLALRSWQANGCRVGTALWSAACWEAAAVCATSADGRSTALMYARAIIAVAKGETATEPRGAA
jgi:hypothetical protein